jgi:hypothetical protein
MLAGAGRLVLLLNLRCRRGHICPEVREMGQSAVEGEDPVHWRLLTTHQIQGVEDALQMRGLVPRTPADRAALVKAAPA